MISLAELEREVARRVGPFFMAAQDSGTPTSSTTTAAIMPSLKSNSLLGGPENLWLLRRSATDATDRERQVQAFDSGAGRVVVDRNWAYPMAPSEMAEFHHLHPTQELRAAVLAGLRRCFLSDRGRLYPNVSGGQVDVTETLPWVTDPGQVLRVQAGYSYPTGEIPFEAISQAGHVLVTSNGPLSPGGMWVTLLRPHWSWVNGDESTTGPTDDDDTLAVDLDYAAAAGHIEAWHLFPSRMFAAAAGNLQASQEMAAREFTRQAVIWGPAPSRAIGFKETVRLAL